MEDKSRFDANLAFFLAFLIKEIKERYTFYNLSSKTDILYSLEFIYKPRCTKVWVGTQ